jgi:hypothetical protein
MGKEKKAAGRLCERDGKLLDQAQRQWIFHAN